MTTVFELGCRAQCCSYYESIVHFPISGPSEDRNALVVRRYAFAKLFSR